MVEKKIRTEIKAGTMSVEDAILIIEKNLEENVYKSMPDEWHTGYVQAHLDLLQEFKKAAK